MANEKRLIGYDPIAFGAFATSITEECEAYNTYDDGYMDGVERIEDWLEFNSVDAVEVVHGHWTTLYKVDTWMGISTIDCFVCSECGKDNNRKRNYCPNCGAKMDGGNEDG